MFPYGGVIFGELYEDEYGRTRAPVILWGYATRHAQVWHGKNHRAVITVKFDGDQSMEVSVAEKNPFFLEASKIRAHDMVTVFGHYMGSHYVNRKGEAKMSHKVYANLVERAIAFTAPEVHLREYTRIPDPIYTDDMLARVKGNPTNEPEEIVDDGGGDEEKKKVPPAWLDN